MIKIYGLNVESFKNNKPSEFFRKLASEQIDVVCLQETNCAPQAIPGYAKLKGYELVGNNDPKIVGTNGVAILSRHRIVNVNKELCEHENCRGRFIEGTIGKTKIASIYAYADSKDPLRAPRRQQFYECIGAYIRREADTPCILVLDANVALMRNDVANDRQWQGPWANGGRGKYRLPLADAMRDTGWVDSYRAIHGDRQRATVWTSGNFALPSGLEEGFGIDFQLVSQPIAPAIRAAFVFKPPSWAERYSDHAPTLGVYDLDLN